MEVIPMVHWRSAEAASDIQLQSTTSYWPPAHDVRSPQSQVTCGEESEDGVIQSSKSASKHAAYRNVYMLDDRSILLQFGGRLIVLKCMRRNHS